MKQMAKQFSGFKRSLQSGVRIRESLTVGIRTALNHATIVLRDRIPPVAGTRGYVFSTENARNLALSSVPHSKGSRWHNKYSDNRQLP